MKFFIVTFLSLYCLCGVSRAAIVELTAVPLWGYKIWGYKTSVGEPVLVRVTLKNPTAKMRYVDVGEGHSADSIYLAVFDDKKRLLSSPPPTGTGGGLSSGRRLHPGKSLSQTYLATAWHRFDREGSYSIRVQFLGSRAITAFQAPLPVLAQHTLQITVGPKNDARLKEKCEELYAWAYPWSEQGGDIRRQSRLKGVEPPMPNIVAMRALLSVRNEVALPFFVRLVKADHYSTGACLALRRLRTQQASKIVADFAKQQDNTGKAAKQALKMSLAED